MSITELKQILLRVQKVNPFIEGLTWWISGYLRSILWPTWNQWFFFESARRASFNTSHTTQSQLTPPRQTKTTSLCASYTAIPTGKIFFFSNGILKKIIFIFSSTFKNGGKMRNTAKICQFLTQRGYFNVTSGFMVYFELWFVSLISRNKIDKLELNRYKRDPNSSPHASLEPRARIACDYARASESSGAMARGSKLACIG